MMGETDLTNELILARASTQYGVLVLTEGCEEPSFEMCTYSPTPCIMSGRRVAVFWTS